MEGNGDGEPMNRIQVVVRVRPVLPHEAFQPIAVTCSSDGCKVQVALPDKDSVKPSLAAPSRPDAKAYEFDSCVTGSTTQAQLFDICGIDELVESAVEGYNVTIFAFGQTGSGKTYSIIGPSLAALQETATSPSEDSNSSEDTARGALPTGLDASTASAAAADPKAAQAVTNSSHHQGDDSQQQQLHEGQNSKCSSRSITPQLKQNDRLLPRCIAHLYTTVNARKHEVGCQVLVSCVEIYNETVTDLLARNKNRQLQVRQDRNEGFYVEGLTQAEAQSPQQALSLMADALSYRHTRAHKLNTQSSRSHCLMTCTVASQELGSRGATQGVRRLGKLVLVDLAGSERLKDTGNSAREAIRETGAINKSLFTLGQVLAALSVRGGCGVSGHVPYRDSRLTQLLWDGLRGGGRALMLACLSPLTIAAEESLYTLHFASMALRIKSQPIIMMDPQDQLVLDMRGLIRSLQDDCKSLAAAISQLSTGADMTAVLQGLPPTLVQDAMRYGSSSAPGTEQGAHRASPCRGLRGCNNNRLFRDSSSDRKLKTLAMLNKPSTADGLTRHSLPALPYTASVPGGRSSPTSSSNPSSPTKAANRSSSRQRLQQQQQPWNLSPALVPDMQRVSGQLFSIAKFGGISSNTRNSWPAFATPPRSGPSSACNIGSTAAQALSTSSLYTGWDSSLRSEFYLSGAAATSSPICSNQGKPGWSGQFKAAGALDSGPALSGLVSNSGAAAGSAAQRRMPALPAAATGQLTAAGLLAGNNFGLSGSPVQGKGQLTGMSIGDFPELAALEQQFQQLHLQSQQPLQQQQLYTLHQQQQQPAGASSTAQLSIGAPELVQFRGASGVLLPSGLPASIHSPITLVPVRVSVADTALVGTDPNTSPVAVAITAADTHERPMAMPLHPEVGSSAPAAAAGTPEPKALSWAEKNMWFGADPEMTQLAYQVHDALVGAGGGSVDPASNGYYVAIESHVAEAFPEKWAHWQMLMAAATTRNKQPGVPRHKQPASVNSSYTSYNMSLKGAVPKFTSSPMKQHQSPTRGSGLHAGATLSQLLQHPELATVSSFNPKQQQQRRSLSLQQQGQQQLPGAVFAAEMLKLYQQHGAGEAQAQQMLHLLQQQQEQHLQLQQTPAAQLPASDRSSPVQQQQQEQQEAQGPAKEQEAAASPTAVAAGAHNLPELRLSASPEPQQISRHSVHNCPDMQQQMSGMSGPAVVQFAAGSVGNYPATTVPLLVSTSSTCGNLPSPASSVLPEQLVTGARPVGGLTPAASRVLASSVPSYYSGARPLTAGSKQSWSVTNKSYGHNVQAGKDLAQVLRSAYAPGNKSLAELQEDYRAARALVLDQLRQQKNEAELQRKRILMQIGRAINNNSWRT